jgi:hypothetical protein
VTISGRRADALPVLERRILQIGNSITTDNRKAVFLAEL